MAAEHLPNSLVVAELRKMVAGDDDGVGDDANGRILDEAAEHPSEVPSFPEASKPGHAVCTVEEDDFSKNHVPRIPW